MTFQLERRPINEDVRWKKILKQLINKILVRDASSHTIETGAARLIA